MIIRLVTLFLVACLASLILTVAVRKVTPWLGLTDRPDGHRKLHGRPMPLGGGVAIFLTMLVVIGSVWFLPNPFQGLVRKEFAQLPFLLGAGAVIVLVGLADDRFGLRGRQKLAGQFIAVSVLVLGGLRIEGFSLFYFGSFSLGLLAVPVTFAWMLGAINALNLLDGIDGLATVVGIILASTVALMGLQTGHPEVSVVATVFAGCLIGFIRFNFPPASIFLGDTGSMLIGLVVGALAIQGSLKGAGTVLLTAPLAVWAIPIFDSVFAVLRRKLTGRSIYTTDRAHLHHRLLDVLGSNRKVLALLAAACGLTSGAALLGVYLKSDMVALITCTAVVVVFIATGVFGRAEMMLLGSRLRQVSRSLIPTFAKSDGARQSSVRLQGSRQWESLWEEFTRSAAKWPLTQIRLEVNSPADREGFHASWERPGTDQRERWWRMEIPFVVADYPIGRLSLAGNSQAESPALDMQEIMELVVLFESQLLVLLEHEVSTPSGQG
jgi:UDP-GlcNAc:undecaprenyl-phosphate GlcNAc-1-phosphate transferase